MALYSVLKSDSSRLRRAAGVAKGGYEIAVRFELLNTTSWTRGGRRGESSESADHDHDTKDTSISYHGEVEAFVMVDHHAVYQIEQRYG
jgi:hypothetical protein